MIDYVKRRLLMEDKPVSLRRLLHNTHTERALICMFLAMLELVRLQAVLLHQPNLCGDILIKKAEDFDQVFADQAQRPRRLALILPPTRPPPGVKLASTP